MNRIERIMRHALQDACSNIYEITEFGSVSRVFSVECNGQEFVIKLNTDSEKFVEFQKEEWCLKSASKLGIPSPEVWATGNMDEYAYLVLEKIPGKNGTLCSTEEKINIWKSLGRFAKTYQSIEKIPLPAYQETVFHASWNSYLAYNIAELNPSDPLLIQSVLSHQEHRQAREILISIEHSFQLGLIHRDLSLRNVIFNETGHYLLDWGTAEIGVVPHSEIGAALMQEEITDEEFASFLQGMGIDGQHYSKIEKEIRVLNLLDSLDRYRWALDHAVEHIGGYGKKVQRAYENAIEHTLGHSSNCR